MTFGYYFFFSTKKVEKMIVPPCDPHGLGSTLCTLTGPRVQCAAVFVYLHRRHCYLTEWFSGVEKGPLDQGTGGSTTDTGATVALFRISNYIKYVLRLATQSFKLTEHSPRGGFFKLLILTRCGCWKRVDPGANKRTNRSQDNSPLCSCSIGFPAWVIREDVLRGSGSGWVLGDKAQHPGASA